MSDNIAWHSYTERVAYTVLHGDKVVDNVLQADVSKRVGLLQNELKLIKDKLGMDLAQQNKLMQSRCDAY